ncbi:MAG: DUF1127 domain-containing protein [Pseudomonadota bacterium]
MTNTAIKTAISTRPSNVLTALVRAHQVSRQRRALSQLPDDILKDLGITRLEANAEARRWFWDLPRTMR